GTWSMLHKQVRPGWAALLALLRLIVLALVVLVLLQPVVSYSSSATPLPELLVLIDTSRSMGQPAGRGDTTRLAETLGILRAGNFATALQGRLRPRWFRFGGSASPLTEQEVSGLEPTGADTRIGASLEDACRLLRAEGKSPRRVLLVSDGNDRGE